MVRIKPALSVKIIFSLTLVILMAFPSKDRAQADVIIDQAGRHIKVGKPFTRIISLYGAHTENLFFLGLDREIIGVSRNEVFPEKARTRPWFSCQDGLEKFLAAAPDLVLVRPMIDRGYPDLVARLERSGIQVASLQPTTVAEMYDYWCALGTLTGKTSQAEAMIRSFKASVSHYKALTQDIPWRKQVYFEAIHSKMKTFAPGSMAVFALETAGGINLAKDAIPSRDTNIAIYGKERLLSRANDIDVFLAQQGVMNPVTVETIRNEPGFSIIKALKFNQVYLIDEILVSRPGYRLLNGIKRIGEILYPDRFTIPIQERKTKQ